MYRIYGDRSFYAVFLMLVFSGGGRWFAVRYRRKFYDYVEKLCGIKLRLSTEKIKNEFEKPQKCELDTHIFVITLTLSLFNFKPCFG